MCRLTCEMSTEYGEENCKDTLKTFAEVSEVEKPIWGRLIYEDMNNWTIEYNVAYTEMEKMKEFFEEAHMQQRLMERPFTGISKDLDSLSTLIEQVENEFVDNMREDFQITGLLRKPKFLQTMAELRLGLNSVNKAIEAEKQKIKEAMEKEQEQRKEEESKAAEVAKYAQMTEKEIQEQLKNINLSKFDMREKYRKIVQFQMRVAKAKGLVTLKETMENENIAFIPCSTKRIPTLMRSANENHIFYSVMLGVDDDATTSIMVVSEQEKKRLQQMKKLNGYSEMNSGKIIGRKMSYEILEMIPEFRHFLIAKKEKKGESYTLEVNSYAEPEEINRIEQMMAQVYKQVVEKDKNPKQIENIKFYIQIPFERSMIPILELLQQEGIEFYIPPTEIKEFDAKKCEPNYRIYIDRKYLDQYKKLHTKISNPEKGVIVIGDEKVKLSELILGDCEFPYGIAKKQKKKMTKEVLKKIKTKK